MKMHLLTVFFTVVIAGIFVSVRGGAAPGDGGDVVRNGGGLSEQALLYSSLHYRSFSERCLQSSTCSAEGALQTALKKVQACDLPQSKDFSFATPQENPKLVDKIFVQEGPLLVVNREALYQPQALRFPQALAFLARIYMDHCQVLKWQGSANIVAPLVKMAEYDGEQITVGKDSIRLPQTEWIRVRSLFSDLLIETPTQIISIRCRRQSIAQCGPGVSSEEVHPDDRFKYLSLAREEVQGGRVLFTVEGHYQPATKASDFFNMKVVIEKGNILSIEWQGVAVPLVQK